MAWLGVAGGGIIDDENPVGHLAGGGSDEGGGAAVGLTADAMGFACAGIVPPQFERVALDVGGADGERAPCGGIDHEPRAVGIGRGGKAIEALSGPCGLHGAADEHLFGGGDAAVVGTREDEVAAVAYLAGAGLLECFAPTHEGVVDAVALGRVEHLPDGVMAVGVAAGSAEEIPVEGATDVGCHGVALMGGIEGHGVVFVDGLAVEDGFHGGAVVVVAVAGLAVEVVDVMVAVLPHVEVEPFLAVVEVGRRPGAAGVVGDEVGAAVAFAESAGEGAHDGAVGIVLGIAVAAQHPDDVGRAVALAEEAAVAVGIEFVEDGIAVVPPAPPRRQQGDGEAQLIGSADDVIDMIPVVVGLAFNDEGTRGAAVDEGQMAVGVGRADAVQFGQRYALDDVEAFGSAVAQVLVGLFTVEAVEQFPRRIAHIEEGSAVGVLQVSPTLRNANGLGGEG